MNFTSLEYLFYFPLIVVVYNLLPKNIRLYFLLAVSYFSMALMKPSFLVMLLISSAITYTFAILIERTEKERNKSLLLYTGIGLVVFPLLLFKNINLVANTLTVFLQSLGITSELTISSWILPLGISYYTFMAIGYLVDVYNEEVSAEYNPSKVALFMSFFPIVFSGPIERSGNMFPQFSRMEGSKLDDIKVGIKLMIWGYFMKFCVADRIGIYIDPIFENYQNYYGSTFTLASLLVPIRQYADLGGYSLLAIGTANCLGFKIVPNFRRPFMATSLSGLWRRWHMSFINWLLDYIYTPISFSLRRKTKLVVPISLLAVFLVSAVWHSADVQSLLWCFSQVVILTLELVFLTKRTLFENKYGLSSNRYYHFLMSIIVYVLFAGTLIFDSPNSLEGSFTVFSRIFSYESWNVMYFNLETAILAGCSIFILLFKDLLEECNFKFPILESENKIIRLTGYAFFICYIIVFGVFNNTSFIYFKF